MDAGSNVPDIMSRDVDSNSYQNALRNRETRMYPIHFKRLLALHNEKVVCVVHDVARL